MRRTLLVTILLAPAVHGAIFFDDFHYRRQKEMTAHGWIVRQGAGWPGVPGAKWASTVEFVKSGGQRHVRMHAVTDGTPANTTQAQLCHERKYLQGTYAARTRFSDAPVSGPDGDQVVETFYMISPLAAPMDPDYSEMDFEYLPNGGWGKSGPTMYTTTWETFRPEPEWLADNQSRNTEGSRAGWHTLVVVVKDESVRYFIDGQPYVDHGGRFAPESMMSINFNLWFVRNGMARSSEPRRYEQDIDWVFFERASLTPAEVDARVASFRKKKIRYRDTVPRPTPALASPCNL